MQEDGSVVTWGVPEVLMDAHLGHAALGRLRHAVVGSLSQLFCWCDPGLCRGMWRFQFVYFHVGCCLRSEVDFFRYRPPVFSLGALVRAFALEWIYAEVIKAYQFSLDVLVISE